MSRKKEINFEEMSREEKMKYEVAEELGLLDRVLEDGWENTFRERDRANWRSGDKTKERRAEKIAGVLDTFRRIYK